MVVARIEPVCGVQRSQCGRKFSALGKQCRVLVQPASNEASGPPRVALTNSPLGLDVPHIYYEVMEAASEVDSGCLRLCEDGKHCLWLCARLGPPWHQPLCDQAHI